MIQCSKGEFRRYATLQPRLMELAKFLEEDAHLSLGNGRHEILGNELFVIASPEGKTRPTALLEAHNRYIDVHVLIDGEEGMGWAPREVLCSPEAPFNAEDDYICFRDAAASVFQLAAGNLVVFFPEDAHVPLLGNGHAVHKCVFKVLCD